MALLTPTITPISTFDASSACVVAFTVGTINTGDQIVGNNLIVQNNSTGTEVYNQDISNYLYTHTIPISTLSNNTTYKAKIRTKNVAGTYSTFSDWVLFTPYATPVISINVSEGAIINNSSFTFTGTYTQANDPIKSFRFIIYDSNSVLLYSYPEVISSTITQIVSGLENNTSYHIELLTISQSGVETSTGLIGFSAQYIIPALASEITLTNQPSTGSVLVEILAVEEYLTAHDYTYQDDDWINITNTGAYVYVDNRLDTLTSDFTMRLHFKNIPSDTVFCTIVGYYGTITIKYSDSRFHAFKTVSEIVGHFINDTDITVTSTDMVCLELKSINNLLDVEAQIYT